MIEDPDQEYQPGKVREKIDEYNEMLKGLQIKKPNPIKNYNLIY